MIEVAGFMFGTMFILGAADAALNYFSRKNEKVERAVKWLLSL